MFEDTRKYDLKSGQIRKKSKVRNYVIEFGAGV